MNATTVFGGTLEGWYIIWIYTTQQKLNSTPSREDKKNLL